MPNLVSVAALPNYCVQLTYDDGAAGQVDLSHLAGQGVFSAWLDSKSFGQVKLGEFGELNWGNGIELCPDALYLQLTGKSSEEVLLPTQLNSHA